MRDLDPDTDERLIEVLRIHMEAAGSLVDAQAVYRSVVSDFKAFANGMLVGKEVMTGFDRGISIRDHDGREVPPMLLSSGEQRLLMLLASVLQSNGRASLFLIDEPERSMHIAWQSNLVRGLTRLADRAQFILATHSFEILSEHQDHVVVIKPEVDIEASLK